MTFLSPWSALLAAMVAIPALLLLYFLKLRRQQMRIPSTLLWEKSFQDLQVNVPFQRLRWSILLILQMLLLLVLLLALADPIARGGLGGSGRMVLLLDRSASMNATDAPGGSTRFDAARKAAREIIEQSTGGSRPAQIMVITFASSAQVISGFESNRQVLLDVIQAIQPTDETANLQAALQLAGAFAANRDEQSNQSPPEVVLISDGGVGEPSEGASFTLPAGRFRYVQVGPEKKPPTARIDQTEQSPVNERYASDNVGIVSFSARRSFDDPTLVQVFARLINVNDQAVQTVISLRVNDQPPAAIQRLTIPAAQSDGVGEESFFTTLDLGNTGRSAVLTLAHNHDDALMVDNTSWLVLPPPSRLRLACVHPNGDQPDRYLVAMLKEMDPQSLDILSYQAYSAIDPQQIDSGARYDLVIFDRVAVQRLPGVPTMTIGAVPPPARARPIAQGDTAGRHFVSWDRQHPVMRHVSLDNLVYAAFGGMELPPTGTPLGIGPDGPVIATLRTRNARHIVVGFQLMQSNWPLDLSIAVFMQNAFDYLTLGGIDQTATASRPGEPITLRAAADAAEIVAEGPVRASVAVQGGAVATLPLIRRAGLYRVTGAAPPVDAMAISALSEQESDIRPRSVVPVNAQSSTAIAADALRGQPLWPWLIALAMGLAALEWLVWCRMNR